MDNNQNADSAGGEIKSLYEKHRTIYVRAVSGLFSNWRWAMVFLTQALFYGLCWVDWNGRQAVLFHLVERKFYIFGLIFWPQDVFYLAVLLIISAYGLFLFTAIAGRLFCGYACPQTVYTEILLWIEQKVEGDRPARMKLDKEPMSARKIRIKATKHLLWLLVCLWTGVTFVGYFSPVKEVMAGLATWNLGPWEIFWIFFYGGFTYLMAGFLREQVCKYMCPYARFQSVMFDPDTLIVTYDDQRGEPRGARKKESAGKQLGDCVDCGICVQVCPTGIDIRNGLQYECIGCGACIDACDQVMDKVKLPRGLIRYSTETAMAKHFTTPEVVRHIFRPRIMLYTAILVAITAAASWSLSQRIPLKVDVIRDRSSLAREADDGRTENVYTLQVMNTDEVPHRYKLSVSGLDTVALAEDKPIEVPAATTKSILVAVRAQPEAGSKGANRIYFEVETEGSPDIRVKEKASFMQQ